MSRNASNSLPPPHPAPPQQPAPPQHPNPTQRMETFRRRQRAREVLIDEIELAHGQEEELLDELMDDFMMEVEEAVGMNANLRNAAGRFRKALEHLKVERLLTRGSFLSKLQELVEDDGGHA